MHKNATGEIYRSGQLFYRLAGWNGYWGALGCDLMVFAPPREGGREGREMQSGAGGGAGLATNRSESQLPDSGDLLGPSVHTPQLEQSTAVHTVHQTAQTQTQTPRPRNAKSSSRSM